MSKSKEKKDMEFENIEIIHPITGEVWRFKGSDYSKLNLKDYSQVEISKNGDKIIYGIEEIGSIYGLYGKDSKIYNAMADGKVVSGMIEVSMKKNQDMGNTAIAKREESLLARCLKREKEQGLGV